MYNFFYSMKKITVQTKLGSCLKNNQVDNISKADLLLYKDMLKRYPLARQRSELEPHYNCFGLVFASSRTCLDYTEIKKIIMECDILKFNTTSS